MVKRSAPAPYHHGDLRHALTAAAAKLVESDGVDALTLRELARRVGVSHAAPAHHFTDKAGLLAELAADGFESLARRLTECTGRRTTGAKRLRDVGRAYIAFARKQPGHYRVMFGRALALAARSPRLAEAGASAFRALEEAVLAALPKTHQGSPEKVRQAAFLAWSSVHGASMLILDAAVPDLAPQGDAAAIETLVLGLTSAVAEAIGR